MVSYLKSLYFNLFIYPRYQQVATDFGQLIIEIYAEKEVPYQAAEEKLHKYLNLCMNQEIKPWNYEQMKILALGGEVPPLEKFISPEEKEVWFAKLRKDEHAIRNQLQKNMALRLIQEMRALKESKNKSPEG